MEHIYEYTWWAIYIVHFVVFPYVLSYLGDNTQHAMTMLYMSTLFLVFIFVIAFILNKKGYHNVHQRCSNEGTRQDR